MRSFRAVLLLGLLAGIGWPAATAALSLGVLVPLASACLQACAANPALMAAARGLAASSIVVAAAGFAVGLVMLFGQLRSTWRLVRWAESHAVAPPGQLERMALELGLAGNVIYVPDYAPYAFCYGFLSPRICVSSGLMEVLSEQEMRAVLLHEGVHLRHRDPLKVLVSRVVAGVLFALPMAADLRDRYLVEKELAADDRVVRQLSLGPLAGALLKLSRGCAERSTAGLAAAAVGPFDLMGARVRHLARSSGALPPLRARRIAASVGVAGLLLAGAVGSTFAAERSLPPGGVCCAATAACDVATGKR